MGRIPVGQPRLLRKARTYLAKHACKSQDYPFDNLSRANTAQHIRTMTSIPGRSNLGNALGAVRSSRGGSNDCGWIPSEDTQYVHACKSHDSPFQNVSRAMFDKCLLFHSISLRGAALCAQDAPAACYFSRILQRRNVQARDGFR